VSKKNVFEGREVVEGGEEGKEGRKDCCQGKGCIGRQAGRQEGM
jgi:hypothetical protein